MSSNNKKVFSRALPVALVAVMFAIVVALSGCGSVGTTDKATDSGSLGVSSQSTSGGIGWSASDISGSSSGSYSSSKSSSADVESVAESYVDAESADNGAGGANGSEGDGKGWDLSGQKIVYTATMKLETTEYDKAHASLKELIETHHGFISSENESQASYKSTAKVLNITVRVPAEEYEAFVAEAGDVATMTSFSSKADNVTRQYSETQSIISSLEVQEKRLLELEAQAANVDELLDIEDRLQEVRSDLMIQRNSLSKLDTDISYSTITITLSDVKESGSATPSVREGLGERLGSGAAEAWDDFVEGFEDFLVDLVSIWPRLLIAIIVIVVVVALIVKRSKKVKAEREAMAANLFGEGAAGVVEGAESAVVEGAAEVATEGADAAVPVVEFVEEDVSTIEEVVEEIAESKGE